MTEFHVRRLQTCSPLTERDIAKLHALCDRQNHFTAKNYIVRFGDPLAAFPVLLKGWAIRYQILKDGSRQIVSLLLPGDTCHYGVDPSMTATDEIVAISDCDIAWVRQHDYDGALDGRSALSRAFQNYSRLCNAILASWVISIGRRNALQRMAHFICEVHQRLVEIDAIEGNQFHFPLTQEDLADVLGLTPVHVNRKLQQLRGAGLIRLQGKQLLLRDLSALRELAGFDTAYLAGEAKRKEAARERSIFNLSTAAIGENSRAFACN